MMSMTTCSTATYSPTSSTTTGPANSAIWKHSECGARTKFVIQTQKLQNWYFYTQGAHQSSQWSLCRASSKNCMIFAQLCGALIHTEMTMKFMKMILGRAGLGISIILG